MAKKIELTPSEILKKKFPTELSGYNAKEVDIFLDKIMRDYVSFEENINDLKKNCESLLQELTKRDELIAKLLMEQEALKDQLHNSLKDE